MDMPEKGWTFETLKEHVTELMDVYDRHCKEMVDSLDKRIYDRFDSDKELRDKLEKTVNDRLEGMNEFRRQLDKQAGTFITWSALFAVSTTIALVVTGLAEVFVRAVIRSP
jgi:Flp pilus assembly protein TadB